MLLNIRDTPFSQAGSFLRIQTRGRDGSGRLMLTTARQRPTTTMGAKTWSHDLFEIALFDGETELPYSNEARPWQLDLQAGGGRGATIAFLDADTLLFEARGCELRLVAERTPSWTNAPRPGEVRLLDFTAYAIHHARPAEGTSLHVVPTGAASSAWTALSPSSAPSTSSIPSSASTPSTASTASTSSTPSDSGSGGAGDSAEKPAARFALAFRAVTGQVSRGALRSAQFETDWREPLPSLADAVASARGRHDAWMRLRPASPERFAETADRAWHLLHHCRVGIDGGYTRPAILVSKSWMNQTWAWDNCFSALAVASADPALAWDQLFLFFDHQAPNGMLPDCINDAGPHYGFVKPPIYGWTVRKLIERLGVERSRPFLAEAYAPMVRMTEWWYAYRDSDGDGMCEYLHGNDAGWDNATIYDQGYPTEGADLAAHLVLQTECLGYMAEALGRPGEAARWHERSQRQMRDLLEQGVRDDRFFSPLSGTSHAEPNLSLLDRMPIVLGKRLPATILRNLVADLGPGGPFLTEWGLASESPRSPKYDPDGYWRGPIWAPPAYLAFDGLLAAGETALARIVAERFCGLCVHTPGLYENYDALTGQGRRCPGLSWTASVFVLLAEWLARHPE